MAFDLTGIENINEFFSYHYLNAILESDLKDIFAEWTAAEQSSDKKTPYRQLESLAAQHARTKMNYLKARTLNEKIELLRPFISKLLYPLGYEVAVSDKALENNELVPVLCEVRRDGRPYLWVIESVSELSDETDIFENNFYAAQLKNAELPANSTLAAGTIEEIISKQIFCLDEPPRWLIIAGIERIALIDRSKWGQKRWMAFDLDEIFGRRELSTLKAFSALLYRDNICYGESGGTSLIDTLDENSHKHAFSVSADLKYGLRRAVELLGNEYIYYAREKHKGIYDINLADRLTQECLRYLYRLLFILYIESRPELKFAPMNSDKYVKGYSLESLRELEIVTLSNDQAKNGYYFDESINKLFNIYFEGFNQDDKADNLGLFETDHSFNTFSVKAIKSHLFDQANTPLISAAKFRNFVLQEIIQLLSLSKVKKGQRRGRISYSQLGINQLGAVYEGILSYTGFFAETDLYEVKPAEVKSADEMDQAYFVRAEDLEKYNENEKVFLPDGSPKRYPRATFIFRLAGRNREKSASYYTPECLTQCVVKYALKELLAGKSADDILKISVCEPAMGSGAFLNEALNQLSEKYLELKQKELKININRDQYIFEKQKVKAYIAANNIYGVDLNRTASELAEVSVWLNTLYSGQSVPWLKLKLRNGNSLIGARREFFDAADIGSKKEWLNKVPQRIQLSEKRPEDKIYHFLLPDEGMADYAGDKVIKQLEPQNITKIKDWKKNFTRSFTDGEKNALVELSKAIDKLWQEHTKLLKDVIAGTGDDFDIFGQPSKKDSFRKNVIQKDDLSGTLYFPFSSYSRLKFVMDYWCSLWFWPIEKAELLPDREDFINDLQTILKVANTEKTGQMDLGLDKKEAGSGSLVDKIGMVDIDKLCDKLPRLKIVKEITERIKFFHWELEFANIFHEKGGFDLILGNPPWLKVTWQKDGILSEFEPLISIKNYSSPEVEKLTTKIINSSNKREQFLEDFTSTTGMKSFLNAVVNYNILTSLQSNLCKCFITKSWQLSNNNGVTGLVHEAEILSETKGVLKREIYKRLCLFLHFHNSIHLFNDVKDTKKFAVTITKSYPKTEVNFNSIVNLFHPRTIDESFEHSGIGPVPGIKTEDNKWEVKGHKSRIVNFTEKELKVFNELFAEEGTNVLDTIFPFMHSFELISVINKLIEFKTKIRDIKWASTEMFHETNSQNDKIIKEGVNIQIEINNVILSGPHIYNCNPYYQNIPINYNSKQDYSPINLNFINADFIQRTLYQPGVNFNQAGNFHKYRNFRKKMVYPMSERSLATAITPPGIKHINGIISMDFEKYDDLIKFTGFSNSIVYDYLVKMIGKTNITDEVVNILPMPDKFDWRIKSRVLRLNCLTKYYGDLWESQFEDIFKEDQFAKKDNRLSKWDYLDNKWDFSFGLKNFFERRQALVEIDVLTALCLGISIEELITIYRIQFPILYKNEKATYYDQKGNIVYSINPSFSRINRKDILENWDEISTDPIEGYYPPFEICNREADMRQAFEFFKDKVK